MHLNVCKTCDGNEKRISGGGSGVRIGDGGSGVGIVVVVW